MSLVVALAVIGGVVVWVLVTLLCWVCVDHSHSMDTYDGTIGSVAIDHPSYVPPFGWTWLISAVVIFLIAMAATSKGDD